MNILSIISSSFIWLPITLAIYSFFKNGSDRKFQILLSIFIVWGIVELILMYSSLHKAPNHFWMNLQCVITTGLFIVYYFLANEFKKKYLVLFLIFYIVFTLLWFLYFGNIHVWSIPFIIITNIILIAFSAYSLIQLINQEQENLFGLYEFWIHAGVLVYFTGTLIYASFFPLTLISKNNSFNNNLLNIHTVVNTIGNLLYTIAFICRIRTFKIKFNLQ